MHGAGIVFVSTKSALRPLFARPSAMPVRATHDCSPPPHWPDNVIYLTKSRLHPSFPPALVPLLYDSPQTKFTPRPVTHPSNVQVKAISLASHPAYGQLGLFSKKKIQGGELIIPYLGILHHTFLPADESSSSPSCSEEAESDYDLSLLRLSASDPRNPFAGHHVSIGVDAAQQGNAARFVNDYRGIGTAPNAEFRLSKGEAGELRMEIWSLKSGVGKGEEILVSYGKSWWGARR